MRTSFRANTFAALIIYLFIREEREREEEEEEELSLVSVLLARARERVFDLSLVSSHLGKDSVVVVVSLVCVVKGREDTNHHPRVLKERDRAR